MNLMTEMTHFIEGNLPRDIRRTYGAQITQYDRKNIAAYLAGKLINEYAITTKAYEEPVRAPEGGAGVWECGSGPELASCYGNENPNWLRNKAANFMRLADLIDDGEIALIARRDHYARTFLGPSATYARIQDTSWREAINHIISLEDK